MTDAEYQRVVSSEHTLMRYPCGVAAGDRLRLRRALHLQNHLDSPVGAVIGTGSIWTVLAGLPAEPTVVWFEDPRGELHTWDDESIWLDFQTMDAERAADLASDPDSA